MRDCLAESWIDSQAKAVSVRTQRTLSSTHIRFTSVRRPRHREPQSAPRQPARQASIRPQPPPELLSPATRRHPPSFRQNRQSDASRLPCFRRRAAERRFSACAVSRMRARASSVSRDGSVHAPFQANSV